jgi:hypothetical protein
VIFYFGNYFAHAATVQTYPGESLRSTIRALVLALLFPAAGISRGLTTIIRCAKRQKTPLQIAARAGALCMVVRTKEWQPLSDGPPIDGIVVRSSMKAIPSNYFDSIARARTDFLQRKIIRPSCH